jgi:tRNA threonylcarbamoyladenosine biosynthesis protein TsaB
MLLAIDTATDRASVAVGQGVEVLAQECIVGARRHASQLLPAVSACLDRAGIGVEQLGGILLADGPGSFTGLRVGAAVAKALARVRPVPVWVAPSLLVCAAGTGAGPGEVVVAASDALRGEVFLASYRFEPDRVVAILEPTVRRPADLPAGVPRSARFCGPGAAKFGATPTWPAAGDLLRLLRLGAALPVPDLTTWEPTYGRPAEAQAKWEREHGRPLDHSAGDAP